PRRQRIANPEIPPCLLRCFCRLQTTLPSQKQLKWSQLRVGLTLLFASATLAVLIFVMSGTGGWFTRKITLRSYFDNAGGLREGAPVRLAGVDIGNVTGIRIVGDKPTTPVEVTMKVNTKYKFNLRKDSITLLATAGVLGETYVDIDSSTASAAEAKDGDTLAARQQSGNRTRDGDLSPNRHDGNVDAGHRTHLRRPGPGGDDDGRRIDRSLRCDDAPHSPSAALDRGHRAIGQQR